MFLNQMDIVDQAKFFPSFDPFSLTFDFRTLDPQNIWKLSRFCSLIVLHSFSW
jgi:hypothetical protein